MKQAAPNDSHYRKRLAAWQRHYCRGRVIRRELKEAGYNPFLELRRDMAVFQDWLAIELNVSKHYLSRVERGLCVPSDQLLARLLRVYKTWKEQA